MSITGLDVAAALQGQAVLSVDLAGLKPRIAAFNGSLGFWSLGLSIEVLGQFGLRR